MECYIYYHTHVHHVFHTKSKKNLSYEQKSIFVRFWNVQKFASIYEHVLQQIFISFLAHFIRSNPLVELVWLHNSMNNPFSSLKLLKIDKWANFQIKSSKFLVKIQFLQLFIPNIAHLLNFQPIGLLLSIHISLWEHNFCHIT